MGLLLVVPSFPQRLVPLQSVRVATQALHAASYVFLILPTEPQDSDKRGHRQDDYEAQLSGTQVLQILRIEPLPFFLFLFKLECLLLLLLPHLLQQGLLLFVLSSGLQLLRHTRAFLLNLQVLPRLLPDDLVKVALLPHVELLVHYPALLCLNFIHLSMQPSFRPTIRLSGGHNRGLWGRAERVLNGKDQTWERQQEQQR